MRALARSLPGAAVAAVLLALAGPAQADAIDGDWCFGDGRTFAIEGSQIVTWGGTRMAGHYTRHAFTYVIPPREPDAGATVDIVLQNEYVVHLQVKPAAAGSAPGPLQVWRRCAPKTS